MKIIIAGAGEIGCHLAKMLSTELHDITVVSNDEDRLEQVASECDVITIAGKPTSIETL
ncbi:MAG: NAD-binding protein, partial [Bacteroidales bacterium]|nr:NAD-binding protein [Bacteroidales bacterium]